MPAPDQWYPNGICRICGIKGQVKNINLYVFGSEGVDICHNCNMLLDEFVSLLARHRSRRQIMEKKNEVASSNRSG